MRKSNFFALISVVAFLTFGLATGIAACGDDSTGVGDSCPGIVCSNCASDDCDVTCDAGETEFCGHFGFFDDPNLRCAWCE
jgi:hypothetical protein